MLVPNGMGTSMASPYKSINIWVKNVAAYLAVLNVVILAEVLVASYGDLSSKERLRRRLKKGNLSNDEGEARDNTL